MAEAPIVHHRPKDDAFHQQRLKMWQPILSPMNVIIIFFVIAVAFIPAGLGLMGMSNSVHEQVKVYVEQENPEAVCEDACEVKFVIPDDIQNDLFVYYQLTNFYQNHRLYVKSQSPAQLMGEIKDRKKLEGDCAPKVTLESSGGVKKDLWPCGLIASSFFNDKFSMTHKQADGVSSTKSMKEDGISWPSDKDKFKQPAGFKYLTYLNTKPSNADLIAQGWPTEINSQQPKIWTDRDQTPNVNYVYWYPDMDTRAYIGVDFANGDGGVNPIKGVTDEHFMVWMRTAALPKFRKLYGKIGGPFKKGDELTFQVKSNFEVKSFGGTKALIISTNSALGGKNSYISTSFLVVGSISMGFAILFILKHLTSDRRKLGDTNLLRWDD